MCHQFQAMKLLWSRMAPSSKDSEPASPSARLMQSPSFNLCILGVYGGFATAFKEGLRKTLLKHPRFSSILVGNKNGSNLRWKRTSVDLENHVVYPDLDPDMESPDTFVEDYMSGMSRALMDLSNPLWELHILNVKLHRDIQDSSFHRNENISLLRRFLVIIWTMILVVFHTLIDCVSLLATLMFHKDTKTPIRVRPGTDLSPKRFVHRNLDLNEVKLVKNAMNVSINDVVLGITEAGLS